MDNRRLILLLIFCFSLVMTWDAWQKHNQPKPVTATSVTPTPTISAGVPQPGAALQPGVSAPAVATQAQLGQTFKVKTDLFAAEIASRGGDLVRLELLKHKDQEDKNKNLVLFEPGHKYYAQSGLIGDNLPNHKTELKLLPGPLEMAEGSNELKVRLEAPVSNGVKAVKVLSFKRGSYQIDVAWEIENGSPNALAPHAYFQIQRDNAAPAGETQMVSTFTGPAVYTEAEKYQKVGFEDIAKDKAKFNKSADNGWLAMVQHYYVSAWVPQGKTPREFFMRKIEGDEKHGVYAAGVILPMNAIAGGSKDAVSVPLYAGPQEQATLKQLAEGLDLVVDYGWLAVIAAPIFWFLEILHKMVGNWGWAIVLLTIAIKLAFFPLSAASYRSMAKMRQVAPRMQHLKERFGDDRQRLNQEMMKLYQSEKINPLGGCLPILIQIPVFIALYWALLGAVEMRDAPWVMWIKDLSAPDPYYVLPVIMMVSMFIQTKLNPTPPDPIQAKVMLFMPLIFGVMFFFFPAGLVLYWVVNNVLSIAQQWQITRMMEEGGKPANDPKA